MNKMLILQASPRKNGNVWQMAEKIEEEYQELLRKIIYQNNKSS